MQGIIINFNQEKGYGFIKTDAFEEHVFVHLTQVKNTNALEIGQTVEFEIQKTKKGLAAINVMAGAKYRSPYFSFGIISFIITLAIFAFSSPYLQGVMAYLLSINLTTFLFYGYDKFISKGEQLRIPELNLQLLALLGGSPAALLAQKFFKHKTVKSSFQIIYWGIVMGQIGVILWLKG